MSARHARRIGEGSPQPPHNDKGFTDYVALYHLESEGVTYSEAWSEAIDTPWSSKIRPHFRDHIRLLANRYERLV